MLASSIVVFPKINQRHQIPDPNFVKKKKNETSSVRFYPKKQWRTAFSTQLA
jgi:hypothetical protein